MSSGPTQRVMIYVQHLLGVGHFRRAQQLASALTRREFQVDLVSGGMPVSSPGMPGVTMHQLPPTYCADASFSRLLDANGEDVDETWRNHRRQQLLELFDQLSPQVLITETFPFGRRMMRFELIPLLQRARDSRHCLQIVSSIRDILQPKTRPGRNREICDLVETCYDHVLVHGDPALARLEDSFADAHRISHKLAYSGYICQARAKTATESGPAGDVLVSAGGSDTGLALLAAAIAARPQTRLSHRHWRILVSPAIDEAAFQRLREQAPPDVTVERNRDDFSSLMQQASLSISQAGYNTITDILGSCAASVVIPFTEANEIEQLLRARLLQDRGRLVMLKPDQLSATSLAAAVDSALDLDTSFAVDLDGAANSAAMIEKWLEAAAA